VGLVGIARDITERKKMEEERARLINYSAASGRSMERNNAIFTPSPYPSPQGEGTSGNPTASGWGIKNIIKFLNHQKGH